MDSTITAIAAACGSLVGAAATIVATWITQRTQMVHAEREAASQPRGAVRRTHYRGLASERGEHFLEKPETFVKLYGILGRIRLVAANPVLVAGRSVLSQNR